MPDTLERPTDLFDRAPEWAQLSAFVTDPTPGLRIAIVHGRRRQGKSYLLRRLAAATGGFYHQALEHEPAQALAELGERLGAHLGVGRLALADWDEALLSIGRLSPRDPGGRTPSTLPTTLGGGSAPSGPAVAVIDEVPYLLERSPHLPSLLQRAVDRSRDDGWPPVRLILCGSAISVMGSLLEGQGALRGRVHSNLVVSPFNYLESKHFWDVADAQLAFRIHAVLGGTPGYRELVRAVPGSPQSFDTWVVEEILSPSSALFREDEWLLGEQRGMESRALYLSVLAAVAGGKATQTAIATELGRSQQSVLHPLGALIRAGLLTEEDDALRRRRPLYRVTDPLVRFHQVVRHPRVALFEDHRGPEAWAQSRESFDSRVLGPHFEQLVREHLRRSGEHLFGVPVTTVGTTQISDRQHRTSHQLDVVALGRASGPRHRAIEAIGETKLRKLEREDLTRLESIRASLPDAGTIRLVLASASGFTPELTARSRRRPDVALISLEDLYSTR